MKRLTLILFLAYLLFPFASGAATANGGNALPNGDHPGGTWDGVIVRPPARASDPAWALRTGLRKGIYDQALEAEQQAAPDIAVLDNGYAAEWTQLLAEFQESFILTGPESIAGLSATKPVLIIPSGGLAGYASSAFFRAGLAEYVRSGGTVLCFDQPRGADFGALPVPETSKLAVNGAGWSEDSGPLYAGPVLADHVVLAGIKTAQPHVETDGYLITLPSSATAVLGRPDGRPTLAIYACGKGWVAVSALYSDFLSGQGFLHDDERTLVRNLILWAKSGGALRETTAGTTISLTLGLTGPLLNEASSVLITAEGPPRQSGTQPRVVPLALKARRRATIPYSYIVPVDAPPGIYHFEYTLRDANTRPLSPSAETTGGWFAVIASSPRATSPLRTGQPITPPSERIDAIPRIEQIAGGARLVLDVRRMSAYSGMTNLLARAANREQAFTLGRTNATLSFEIPADLAGKQVAYAVSLADGRCLARGSAPVPARAPAGIFVNRPWYRPGDRAILSAKGLGPGELSLAILGTDRSDLLSADKSYEVPVPAGLPAAVYPLHWEFQPTKGPRRTGDETLPVNGITIRCSGSAIKDEKETNKATASLRCVAAGAVSGTVRLLLADGDRTVADQQLSIVAGTNSANVPFLLPAGASGITTIRYTLLVTLPEGPGYPKEPVALAAGNLPVDTGDAAVLDVGTGKPVYYALDEQAAANALVFVEEAPVKVEVLLDGKRVGRETIRKPGMASLSFPLDRLSQKRHSLAAAASGENTTTEKETSFVFGALMPDLAVNVMPSLPKPPAMEVGVGVTNMGRVPSPASTASLYDGDPEKGGVLIKQFNVPPLEPGKSHVAIIPWPLAGMAGEHLLTAVANRNRAFAETDEKNDRSTAIADIPDLLLKILSPDAASPSNDPIPYRILMANFTGRTFKDLVLHIDTADPAGSQAAKETADLPELVPGGHWLLERKLAVAAPREGTYSVTASASARAEGVFASDTAGIAVQPTLAVNGSLAGTPAIAAPCRPFAIRYDVQNAGNLPVTAGSLKLEIHPKNSNQPVFAKQLSYAEGAGTATIANLEFSKGEYTLSLRAGVSNGPHALDREFRLANQSLSVENPVTASRSSAPFPRILIWAGGEASTAIERALREKMIHEAFDGRSVYSKTVAGPDEFESQALTGIFDRVILFDIGEVQNTVDVLRTLLSQGSGVVLAGTGDRTRVVAESLGFRFTEAQPNTGVVVFPPESVLGLTGSAPVSGPVLLPAKKGAIVAALAGDKRPAVLLDRIDKGKVLVLPLSLTESALASGTTALYSPMLRQATVAVAPDTQLQGTVASVRIQLTSPAGPVNARIVETLPPGAKLLWANRDYTQKPGGAMNFSLTADRDPASILYLYEPAPKEQRKPAGELFYDCGGTYIRQGAIE